MNGRLQRARSEQPTAWAYLYDDQGAFTGRAAQNTRGVVLRRDRVTGEGTKVEDLDAEGKPSNDPDDGYAWVDYELDARGFVAKETYHSPSGSPRAERSNGAYGYTFVRDAQGRPIETTGVWSPALASLATSDHQPNMV